MKVYVLIFAEDDKRGITVFNTKEDAVNSIKKKIRDRYGWPINEENKKDYAAEMKSFNESIKNKNEWKDKNENTYSIEEGEFKNK